MQDKIYTAGIYTLGCKVNQYESEAIAERLAEHGITVSKPSSVCDIYIINTCTVTAESDRKACQFIRRAIQKNPAAYILVTGCLAQTDAERIAAISGVDYISGNTNKLAVADYAIKLISLGRKNDTPKIEVSDINESSFEKMSISEFGRTRAYVKIEDGCENKCAYCIIPSARGKIRSKEPQDVLSEVRALVRGGCREVVLTGIETASYGKDLGGVDLADLLVSTDCIDGLERMRLGSLGPSLISKKFVEKIAPLSTIAPHFHLSLQSGSSRVLALMKRKYNADMAMRAINLIREYIPNAQFTTDVIVGFPGETDEDFEETMRFAKEARFLMIHVFPYSKRKGTVAAQMKDQVAPDIKRKRAETLSALAADIRAEILSEQIGKTYPVLFETYRDGVAHGHTANFIEVSVKADSALTDMILDVEIVAVKDNVCIGVMDMKEEQ